MTFNGVDVSSHNGKIDWSKAVEAVDFAMIRAGYGRNNIDEQLSNNVNGCKSYSIDFGFYWFSYALSESDAIKEADYVCNIADKYKPLYPIAYDWEYDSDNYAVYQGVKITNDMRTAFAKAFLSRVSERGYKTLLYTNVDYLNKGFSKLTSIYDIWLAHWGVNSPSRSCKMWQKTDAGTVVGIKGNVDLDVCYKDYRNNSTTTNTKKETTQEQELEKLKENYWRNYVTVAKDIIKGKYGNGADRKQRLKSLGYDYELAQGIVNILVKKR